MSPSKFVRQIAATLASVSAVAFITAGAVVFVTWPHAEAAASEVPAPVLAPIVEPIVKVAPVAEPKVVAVDLGTPKATTPMAVRPSSNKARAARLARAKAARARAIAARRARLGAKWRRARASWYGPGFYGHTMAGGGRLGRNSMVVAHRSLPFGTKVEILYKGRIVVAEVRDRGPYVGGRQFDLGPGTAKKLKFGGVGTIRFRILRRG